MLYVCHNSWWLKMYMLFLAVKTSELAGYCRYLAAAKQWLHFPFVDDDHCWPVWPAAGSSRTSDRRWHDLIQLCHVLNVLCYSGCSVRVNGWRKIVCPDWYGTTLSNWSKLVTSWSARFGFVTLSLTYFNVSVYANGCQTLMLFLWYLHIERVLRFSWDLYCKTRISWIQRICENNGSWIFKL